MLPQVGRLDVGNKLSQKRIRQLSDGPRPTEDGRPPCLEATAGTLTAPGGDRMTSNIAARPTRSPPRGATSGFPEIERAVPGYRARMLNASRAACVAAGRLCRRV